MLVATAALLNLQARRDGKDIDENKSVLAGGMMCASSGCHDDESLSTFNTDGSVVLEGLPATYEPGQVYQDLRLIIEDSQGGGVFGFQMAALFEDGSSAGQLLPDFPNTDLFQIDEALVLLHTPVPLQTGEVPFVWRAPFDSQGDVLFRVAANAANDNNDPSFDHINTLEQTVSAPVPSVESYFAQVGDGVAGNIRFTTSLILVNSSSSPAEVQVDLFDSNGDPLEVELGELGSGSSFAVELEPEGGFSAETAGEQDLRVGYMRLSAPPSVGGTAVFRRSQVETGIALFETGVPASSPLQSFSLFVDQRAPRSTGLAIVNTGDQPAEVTLSVFSLQGVEQNGSPNVIELQPGNHRAQFVDQLLPDLPVDFAQGTMTVESTQPLAAVTLRQEADPAPFPASVPLLTAFPVVPR
ncbi:MAG TPA: choice-of-anchor V domain-containing protein [Acidobacteriota bacterium]|nr:choice-of-anchor V domain-containing protein [Acidobacteriota bacterium]